jgi:hypothetical protein
MAAERSPFIEVPLKTDVNFVIAFNFPIYDRGETVPPRAERIRER